MSQDACFDRAEPSRAAQPSATAREPGPAPSTDEALGPASSIATLAFVALVFWGLFEIMALLPAVVRFPDPLEAFLGSARGAPLAGDLT